MKNCWTLKFGHEMSNIDFWNVVDPLIRKLRPRVSIIYKRKKKKSGHEVMSAKKC